MTIDSITDNIDNIYEEILLNQWQPLQTMLYDGWVLRFANGYTKRANSVNAIYHSNEDLQKDQLLLAKIKQCEQIYSAHQLKTVFKITPFIQPKHLDEVLDKEGYSIVDHTSVQTLNLQSINLQTSNLQTISSHSLQTIKIDPHVNEEWLEHFCALNQVEEKHRQTMQQMLSNQLMDKGFFRLYQDHQVVACGLGMVERKHLGLFDIVTHPSHRNKGFGEQLLLHILQWGRDHGAEQSDLAVIQNNFPALKLYSKLGYKEIYQYWYRVK